MQNVFKRRKIFPAFFFLNLYAVAQLAVSALNLQFMSTNV